MHFFYFLLWSTLLISCSSSPSEVAMPAPKAQAQWEKSLQHVTHGVVALRVTVPRDFDTETSGAYLGTGFVVDADQGIILSNRHLVQPGPVMAEAIFLNHEEIDIYPIYRDPVHDFGFFKYDPSKLKFAHVEALELVPEAAHVGVDIRVVGNDNGEKLSILSGTLARLDRDAPKYSEVGYNDFNTFYFQAASGTSGGSSGSPVVDIQGRVLALNAGGAFLAESSFFLPLDRVVRALHAIQKGQTVSRGTLETIFVRKPFDELKRLGLSSDLESQARAQLPQSIGLLTVDEIVPQGPGDGVFEVGDILWRIQGKWIRNFVQLEEILDSSVGQTLCVQVVRSGKIQKLHLKVRDLHQITPDEYIEVGRAVIHPLSYQQARNFHMPVQGLYVTDPGYMLANANMGAGTIFESVNGIPVPDMQALWKILSQGKDREKFRVRYQLPFEEGQTYVSTIDLDRRWFPTQWCKRTQKHPLDPEKWVCQSAPLSSEVWTPSPTTAALPKPEISGQGKEVLDKVMPSMVIVEANLPFPIEGIQVSNYRGTGWIIDAKRGWVLTDRNTVPIRLADVQILVAGAFRVPAQVIWLHPTHNLAIVQYPPELLEKTPVQSIAFDFSNLKEGDKTWLVGIRNDDHYFVRSTKVDRLGSLQLNNPEVPAFRESNLEVYVLDKGDQSLGGALVDDQGRIQGLWLSFYNDGDQIFLGMPTWVIQNIVKNLGTLIEHREMGVEWIPLNLADARELGLQDPWLQKFSTHRNQILSVHRRYASSVFPEAQKFKNGDLLLEINGQIPGTFEEVELWSQRDAIALKVLRDGQVLDLNIHPKALDGRDVDQMLSFGGMILHNPHLAVSMQQQEPPQGGVWISWVASGSPAEHNQIEASQWILSIDHQPTPDLQTLQKVVRALKPSQAVRLKLRALDGAISVKTMKLNTDYWPTWSIHWDGQQWIRQVFDQ